MKKRVNLTLLFLTLCFTSTYAQQDITKFLGIPITGTKSEMTNKLKSKGFIPSEFSNDALIGEFNGIDVNLFIATNNNKVYRIVVGDQNSINETDIKIRFNKLCEQFLANPNYISANPNNDFIIPEKEKISYEMLVNKKRYDAAFYQKSELNPDKFNQNRVVWFMISENAGKYYIIMYYDNEINKANGEDL